MYEMGLAVSIAAPGTGERHGWTLIAEHEKKVNGKTIRPDGTFKDGMNLVRGDREAKDYRPQARCRDRENRKAG